MFKVPDKLNLKSGFTLPEVLIAASMLGVVVVGLIQILSLVHLSDMVSDQELYISRLISNYANLYIADPTTAFVDPSEQVTMVVVGTPSTYLGVSKTVFRFSYIDPNGSDTHKDIIVVHL